eukprot:TRINITY_DN7053_c0_g1_i1.p1 TRINITY_DN7053_c0_g1~~TRINITY_DN7053_c0_g1_i1.p1  ORF type:complete len:164 (+),score=28.47 TRINITY_DN7053_c0_g1_i1:74-565(+)
MQSVHQNIPINSWQRVVLAVGSSFLALANPTRGDLVAVLSETTGVSSLGKIVSRMRETEEGQQLLKDKPIINSKNLNLDRLSKLPKDTFGYQYWSYLDTHKISPDTRMPIRFVPDPEMAYALLRYRQTHDFLHTLTGLDVTVHGEVRHFLVEYFNNYTPSIFL